MKQGSVFPRVVDHPVGVLMLFLAAVVFGWVSYQRLAINLMPDISYPSLTVRTEVQGAAPQEVETQVSRPIEEALATIQGLVDLESRSRAELSDVVLEFDWNSDMDQASQDVRERLQVTMLPDDASRPIILRYDPSQDPMLRIALTTQPMEPDQAAEQAQGELGKNTGHQVAGSPGPDTPPQAQGPETEPWTLYRLRDLAEHEIKPQLEAMDGIAAVRVKGGLERMILIQVREDWLAARGVTVEQVRDALISQNVNISGGSIREANTEYLIRTLNQLKSVDEIQGIEIRRADGNMVKIADVAQVRESHKDREVMTHMDGREAVELEVYREADANIVQLARTVKERLGIDREPAPQVSEDLPPEMQEALQGTPTIADTLPDDIRMEVLDDQAAFIEASVSNLRNTAMLGGVLAIVVLFAFLRDYRATAIIATAIPVSIIATFAPMYLSGVSLNLMSLGGLALGVGMLVDNAVVVLESIQTHVEKGMSRRDAAVRGVQEVSAAVTASTLTTVAVFFPIVFVEGIAGQIFGDLSLAVVFSLLASLVVALFLVPMLAARQLANPPPIPLESLATTLNFPSVDAYRRARARLRGWRRILWPWVLARLALHYCLDLAAGVIIILAWLLGRVAVWGARKLLPFISRVLMGMAGRFGTMYQRFAGHYDSWLGWALARPGTVLGTALMAMALCAVLFQTLGSELIPEIHQGRFTVETALPVGTPLDANVEVIEKAESIIAALPGVSSVYSTIGSERRADSEPDEGEHSARLLVQMEPGGDLARRERQLMDMARSALQTIPRISVNIARPVLFSFQAPVEVLISGTEIPTLKVLSQRATEAMRKIPGLEDVRCSLVGGFPEIRIQYDRVLLHRYGMDPATVAATVRNKIQGADARELIRGDRRIDMLVRLDEKDRATLKQLHNLNVNPALVPPIPLDSVATIVEGEGPSEIRRVNQKRVAVISANLEGFDLSAAAGKINETLDQMSWPQGYEHEMAGQNSEMQSSLASMRFALLLSVFLVYAIMASTFESLLHPLIILGSLPLAALGVVTALALLDMPLSVVSLIGVIVLAGVVVNNAIVLVDAINRRRRQHGMSLEEAIQAAARIRLRPILITASTTVLGLAPLAMGLGEGSEIQRPLAVTVIAGLSSSTLLTLLVIPVLYKQSGAWAERLRGRQVVTSPSQAAQ